MLHIKEVLVGTFWKQKKAEFGQIHCPASSNFQTQFSTLCQTLPKMILGSNVVVLYSAHYSGICRTGRDRDCEIWTCKKTQASQHCLLFSEMLTKRNRATSRDLFVRSHCEGHSISHRLRRSGHRQWTLFNDALHISREWRQLRTVFSNRILVLMSKN